MNKKEIKYGLGLSIGTVHFVRRELQAAFNVAVNEKLLAENPVSRVKLPAIGKSSANPLSIEEALAFISVKDRYWYGDAFVFQLHTGLRHQELMALIWEDIDFIDGTVRIERACKWLPETFRGFGSPKSDRGYRTIELSPEVLKLLKAHLEKQRAHIKQQEKQSSAYGERKIIDWIKRERPNQSHRYEDINLVFPNQEGRVPCIGRPRAAFKQMLRSAGLDEDRKIRWYDLRHTHATYLLTMGVPPHEVAERMGHSVNVLFSVYAHVLPERQKMASNLFAGLVPVSIDTQSNATDVKEHLSSLLVKAKERFGEMILKALTKKKNG